MIEAFLWTFFLFVIIVSVLVLVHEAGHFFTARFFGVRVDEFGIGFPPRAAGIRIGSTVYTLNWLPFGGFVRLKGEQGESRTDPDSFASQSMPRRLAILLAGVFMNLATAVLLFSLVSMIGVTRSVTDDATRGVSNPAVHIFEATKDSPADRAGIEAGDVILSINGASVETTHAVQDQVRKNADQEIEFRLKRGDDVVTRSVRPQRNEEGQPMVGIRMQRLAFVKLDPVGALVQAGIDVKDTARSMFLVLGQMIGKQDFSNVAGPVGIAKHAATAWNFGIATFLALAAQLSVSLAILNVLPIPALDGGRAAFVLLELIHRKRLREEIENIIHLIGFALLLGLIALVTYHDIVRWLAG